jgi:hypothetical protein
LTGKSRHRANLTQWAPEAVAKQERSDHLVGSAGPSQARRTFMRKINESERPMPEIDLAKVCFIIEKSREYIGEEAGRTLWMTTSG